MFPQNCDHIDCDIKHNVSINHTGQPVVAKVVQTPSMGQQTPNLLVVGQARMAQPNTGLLVPGGGSVAAGMSGFIVGGNVVGDKNGAASAIIGSLQQTQQLQQAQHLLQQPHQQQNLLNSLVTLSAAGVNSTLPTNQTGSLISCASIVNMDAGQHGMVSFLTLLFCNVFIFKFCVTHWTLICLNHDLLDNFNEDQ